MKSLYTDTFHYSPEALDLVQKTDETLRCLFAEYAKQGYSPREIAHLMSHAITNLECKFMLKPELIEKLHAKKK